MIFNEVLHRLVRELSDHRSVSLIGGDDELAKFIIRKGLTSLKKQLSSQYIVIKIKIKGSMIKRMDTYSEVLDYILLNFIEEIKNKSSDVKMKIEEVSKNINGIKNYQFKTRFQEISRILDDGVLPYLAIIIEDSDNIFFTNFYKGFSTSFGELIEIFTEHMIGGFIFIGQCELWDRTREPDRKKSPFNMTEVIFQGLLEREDFIKYLNDKEVNFSNEIIKQLYYFSSGNCKITDFMIREITFSKLDSINIEKLLSDISTYFPKSILDICFGQLNDVIDKRILSSLLLSSNRLITEEKLKMYLPINKLDTSLERLCFLGFIRRTKGDIELATGILREYLEEKLLPLVHFSQSAFNSIIVLLEDETLNEITRVYGKQSIETYLYGNYIASGILLGISLEFAISDILTTVINTIGEKNLAYAPNLQNIKTAETLYKRFTGFFNNKDNRKTILEKIKEIDFKLKSVQYDKVQKILQKDMLGPVDHPILKVLRDNLVHPSRVIFSPRYPNQREMDTFMMIYCDNIKKMFILKKAITRKHPQNP